jgi:hypothetical protein
VRRDGAAGPPRNIFYGPVAGKKRSLICLAMSCLVGIIGMSLNHGRSRSFPARKVQHIIVLVGSKFGAGELRDSISDTLCDERMDRFQTRVGF